MPGSFVDTNVLVYVTSADPAKAGREEAILPEGDVFNVQVRNELARSQSVS